MRSRWTFLLSVAWLLLLAPASFGQSLLEQLEKKVRDGLELTAPKNSSTPSAPAPTTSAQGTSEAELPPPASKKAPPPPPKPSVAAPPSSTAPDTSAPNTSAPTTRSPSTSRRSSSILEPSSVLDAPNTNSQPPAASPLLETSAEESAATYLGLEAESLTGGGIGARVVTVTENSPAWRAGFRVDDIILAIDGYAIANLDTMVERLALRRPGDAIKVLLLRSGRNIELTAVLQNAATAQRIQGTLPLQLSGSAIPGQAWMGVVVSDLSTAFRNQFNLRVYRAAAVTNVSKGSPADLVGLQPGDAIIAVDSRPIESARELMDLMATKRPGDVVTLSAMRGARTASFDVTLTADPKMIPPPAQALRRPAQPDVQVPPPPTALELGENPLANKIPIPTAANVSSSVEQLRQELQTARAQLSALEQRIAELENQVNTTPQ